MTDGAGNVLGIRLRRQNGFKFSVTGSKEGLFLPSGIEAERSPLLVCEGPTDTAAMLDLDYRIVVGRPSCTGGIKLLVEVVRQRQLPEVVIVSDGDEPGRRGADNLARVLVAYAPAVRVIAPPEGVKDVRAWLQAGGSRRVVAQAIDAAIVRRLVIRARVINGTKG
jgi:DNA primase